MVFTALVVFELVRLHTIRMHYHLSIFSNRYLLGAILLSLALQAMIMYVPSLANLFDVVSLGLMDWAWIVAAAVIMVGLNTVIHKVRNLSVA